ncbi:MAG: tRNA pseudouridine(38-40) synthase TruA [Gammaproteobacteria bacterium]|jgi:tRNA pseudouridine38-40 synthase|nr:tRNA pseudouridine(38-40) synthase TruA [Gammaproteobacteria bacterium]
MQRIALGIEYDGSNYFGWQRQQHQPSIQAHVEFALSKVAAHPISVFCAGRTDAGVHAFGQVIHFDTQATRPEFAWLRGVNTYLPKDIRVMWCKLVESEFDARKSALWRRYCYVINNRSVCPGILNKAITWVLGELETSLMQIGAKHLIGSHDFSSFRGTHCQAKTATRTIHNIEIIRRKDTIIIDVKANAFLHHMVRNIVGTLIVVGQRKSPPEWIREVLHAKDRRAAGVMAPANGLYLVDVGYPTNFSLPKATSFPWFLE